MMPVPLPWKPSNGLAPTRCQDAKPRALEHLILEGQLRHIMERMPDLDPGIPKDWRTLQEALKIQRQPGTERMTTGTAGHGSAGTVASKGLRKTPGQAR